MFATTSKAEQNTRRAGEIPRAGSLRHQTQALRVPLRYDRPSLKREGAIIWETARAEKRETRFVNDFKDTPKDVATSRYDTITPGAHKPGSFIASQNGSHHALVKVEVPEIGEAIPPAMYVEPPVIAVPHGVQVFKELAIEDVTFRRFHPDDVQTHVSLWLKADSPSSGGGLTRAEFGIFCAKCVKCGRFTSDRNFCQHKCPVNPVPVQLNKDQGSNIRVPLRDVITLYGRFHCALDCPGLTKDELEFMFVTCPICEKYLTRGASYTHLSYHDK